MSPEIFELKEGRKASRNKTNGGEWCGGYEMGEPVPHSPYSPFDPHQPFTTGAQLPRLRLRGEALKA